MKITWPGRFIGFGGDNNTNNTRSFLCAIGLPSLSLAPSHATLTSPVFRFLALRCILQQVISSWDPFLWVPYAWKLLLIFLLSVNISSSEKTFLIILSILASLWLTSFFEPLFFFKALFPIYNYFS